MGEILSVPRLGKTKSGVSLNKSVASEIIWKTSPEADQHSQDQNVRDIQVAHSLYSIKLVVSGEFSFLVWSTKTRSVNFWNRLTMVSAPGHSGIYFDDPEPL